MNQSNSFGSSLTHQQGYIGQRPALLGSEDSGPLLAHALDEIACGVIIIDEQARMQHCNLAGQMILQRSQWLTQQSGQIAAKEANDAPVLAAALAKAQQGKRSMLTLGSLNQGTVAVVPLDRPERWAEGDAPSAAPPVKSLVNTRVALIFSRSGMCETLMLSFFARAYQLTRSEEQVLSLLCVGHTAPEMAKQLRVGESTVRTHIRSICQKTHSHGIREVTKRLALLPPLMAAVMPHAFA
jgi:DNA-binding CsgD family transcriptional regulator